MVNMYVVCFSKDDDKNPLLILNNRNIVYRSKSLDKSIVIKLIQKIKWGIKHYVNTKVLELVSLTNLQTDYKKVIELDNYVIHILTKCPLDLEAYHDEFCKFYGLQNISCGDYYSYKNYLEEVS